MFANYETKQIPNNINVSVNGYKNLNNLPHWHIEHELIFIKKGTAEIMINNSVYRLTKGMAAFVSQEMIHNIKSDQASEIWVLKIQPGIVKRIIGNKLLEDPILKNDYNIKKIMLEISREFSNKKENFEIIADCMSVYLTSLIFRNEQTITDTPSNRQSTEKFRELLEKINSDYATISFDTASQFMCFSRSYFSKYFQQMTGMSFTQYLNTVRISAAVDMLSSKSKQITDVAFECGFGTIRSFNRVYKSLTGFAPSNTPKGYTYISSALKNYKSFYDPTLSCTETVEIS